MVLAELFRCQVGTLNPEFRPSEPENLGLNSAMGAMDLPAGYIFLLPQRRYCFMDYITWT